MKKVYCKMTQVTVGKKLSFSESLYHFCIMLWLLSSSNYAFADNTSQLGNAVLARKNNAVITLTMTATESIVRVNSSTGLCDFGDIDPLTYDDSSGYNIAHNFTLVNDSKKAITIDRVQGSDPHLTYDLPMLQKQLPVTVAPGSLITIQLYYKLLPLIPGDLNAFANVFVANQTQPAATLKLRGNLKDVVVFDPPLLDFGQIGSEEMVSKILKVVYDPHMYPSILPLPLNKLPRLAGDQSFIKVKLMTISSSKRALSYNTLRSSASLQSSIAPLNDVITYLVTIRSPAAGPFRGYLSVLPVEGTIGYDLLKSRSVAIQGNVSSKSVN